MHQREIDGFMKTLAPVIGAFVVKAMEPLQAEARRLSEEVAKLRAELDAAVAERSLDIEETLPRLVNEAVAKIPPALPGKDAEPEMVAALVEKAVAALDIRGEPGASVTVDDVAPIIADAVGKAVAAIELPQPDLAQIALMIGEKVDAAVASLPVPKDGAPGPQGEPGAPGVPGAPGKDGEPGRDGKSVEIEDLQPLVAEVVEEAVGALPKQPVSLMIDEAGHLVAVYEGGETKKIGMVRGKDGARGASVMQGSIDENGILHLTMSDNRDVMVGHVRGADGAPGQSIEGRPGRDALEVQILAGIDETRTYPEGVCARWRGGVIRSDRQTSPILDGDITEAGWSVILEGIAEESEEVFDDGRSIERTTRYTSGRVFTRKIRTASVLDRGAWRERAYEKGDGVTYAGSFTIAQRDTRPDEKPGQSDAWRLAVRRGRDGQDGQLKEPRVPKPVKV